ncbi:MAG: acyltransferase [Abitibacteriaceae bacterium]|nr:acyltransferase [Abditibacteriaceae bacterium]MBV9865349.1 acyltransferase [Abditibacteriaceae bacterium]
MRILQKALRSYEKRLDKSYTRIWRIFGPLVGVSIGKGTIIRRGALLSTKYGGSIHIGDSCEILPTAKILTYGGAVRLGNACSLNYHSIIYGHGGVTIGNGVRIAAHCVLIPANHTYDDPNTFIYKQPEERQGITIKDDVWLGANCTVLDGVCIEQGCVVGAGAVVTKSTEPMGIYVGVPARKVKSR